MKVSLRIVRVRRKRAQLRNRRRRLAAARPAPAAPYGECLDAVRGGEAGWEQLLGYDREYAPSPEEVIRHVVEGRPQLGVADWGVLLRYTAVRCWQEPWHYRPVLGYVDDLLRRYDFPGAELVSATGGVALYARDAATAVGVLHGTGAFHERTYAWVAVPQVTWDGGMEAGALVRLHLNAAKFYARYTKQLQVPSVLLGVHAYLAHAAVRNDRALFWDVVDAVGSAWGVRRDESAAPLLIPESIELLLASSARGRLVPPSARPVLAALLRRAGREPDAHLPLLPAVQIKSIAA